MINTKNAIVTFTNLTFAPEITKLVDENGNRVGLLLYNYANKNFRVYINYDDEMSDESFSFIIPPNTLYELPYEYTTMNFYGTWEDQPTGTNPALKITEISDR